MSVANTDILWIVFYVINAVAAIGAVLAVTGIALLVHDRRRTRAAFPQPVRTLRPHGAGAPVHRAA
jgi:hypothetical protein